jgi:salicylate hydroxylase
MTLPIIVVGGGIGGLATAIALARIGREVRVLEQAQEFREVGAGIQLGPNAFRAFEALGVRDAIDQVAVFPEELVSIDAITGEELNRTPTGTAFRDRFIYPYGLIHRADLHAALLRACQDNPRITTRASQRVVDVDDTGEVVNVTTEAGETLTGAALIGADGLWSTVRKLIAGDSKPRVSGHIAYRAVIPMSEAPPEGKRNAMVVRLAPSCHLVHYPLRRGELFNLVAVFRSHRYEEGWDLYGDPNELAERFVDTRPEVRALLAKIDSWRMWSLCDREPIDVYSKGRITLLGDAAHPMLQYLAQGACMALEDAVYLAKMIDKSAGDFARAFVDYERVRAPRCAKVQLAARAAGDVMHASGEERDKRNANLRALTLEQSIERRAWLYDPLDEG